MRTYIANLSACHTQGHTAAFTGSGGKLTISCFAGGVMRFAYHFDSTPPDPRAERAAQVMVKGWQQRLTPLNVQVDEQQGGFVLTTREGTKVVIDHATATPAVYQNGILQHGGFMGDSDTVIPAFPARVITDGGAKPVLRLNFPLAAGDRFYGLGDKAGLPDRRGRRYAMHNRDSLGYDAAGHDPLYKSVPFVIRHNPQTRTLAGLFFPHPAIRWVDLGRESPYYFALETVGGPFEYWLFLGNGYGDIMRGYCGVTGLPALPPWFSFGFFGSSMNYVEPDDAAQRVLQFFEETEKRGIPCEGMYVSSGYLKADDGKRYALLWNKKKFPDYGPWLKQLAQRGYNLLMNIKPGFLVSHPWYEELTRNGFFIQDAQGHPVVEYFWGGFASFLDFTNEQARRWWMDQLKAQYLDHGCTGIWNDNNELELEDTALNAWMAKSVYPVLMAEASHQAFLEQQPQKRPWVYSRAGTAGLQRYARTWTGDNRSDFETLRYNQYMGTGLGLSGLPFAGHDLGGFFGETPGEELLVRSCETGVFQARFVIHSWRPDGVPTEPWMYENSAETIRSLILEHYRFLPYIYNCAIEAANTGLPLERMLCLAFTEDDALTSDDINVLFGPWVLKVNAVNPGQKTQTVRLPKGYRWYDPREQLVYEGGQTISLPVPMDGKPHYLLREGAIVPTNPDCARSPHACLQHTAFLLMPGQDSQYTYVEDDGSTHLTLERYNAYDLRMHEQGVSITRQQAGYTPTASGRRFTLQLPKGLRFTESGKDAFAFDPDALPVGQPMTLGIESTS